MKKNTVDNFIKKSIMLEREYDNKTGYYKFGYEYFGPFLYGYIQWLQRELRRVGIKKVFFFSRDGYMMLKAFKLLDNIENVEAKYAYFSRKSIQTALFWRCKTFEESLNYLPNSYYISLAALLEYYGYTKLECIQIAQYYNLELDEDLFSKQIGENNKIHEVYDILKNEIYSRSYEQSRLLNEYLDQIDFNGACAMVDIGWNGSMQYCLEEHARLSNRKIGLFGYYIGINPKYNIIGDVDGYLFHPGNLRKRKQILCSLGILERLFQSCEGSTYRYEKFERTVMPILSEYEYVGELQLQKYICDWQTGALDCVRNLLTFRDAETIEIHEWAKKLIDFGKNPSWKELQLFCPFYNADGKKAYYISQKELFQYSLNEFIHAWSNSAWKTGFLKSIFRLPLPYYWVYWLLKK